MALSVFISAAAMAAKKTAPFKPVMRLCRIAARLSLFDFER